MKFILLLLSISISALHAQPTLFKQWVGLRFEYIEFYKDSALIYNPLHFKLEPYNAEYNDSTITLTPRRVSATNDLNKIQLYVHSLSLSTLVLKTSDSVFNKPYSDTCYYTFVSYERLKQRTNSFQKLVCSFVRKIDDLQPFIIEVDSLGSLHTNFCYETDNKPKGLYVGRLNINQFSLLLKLIDDSDLQTITHKHKDVNHPISQSLLLFSDNQVHYDNSEFPFGNYQKLVEYLHSLCKKVTLTLSKEKFEFSKP